MSLGFGAEKRLNITYHLVYVLCMASPDLSGVLHLFQRVAPVGVLEYLQKQLRVRVRRGIYFLQVVREEPGGNLHTGHAVSGVQVA